MEYTTITSKGQITVPKEIRDKFKWGKGTKLKFYLEGEEIKVKQVTVMDEMEDFLLNDLMKAGYKEKELKTKLTELKSSMNEAFDRLLKERLREETIPLDEAIRRIENDEV